MTGPDHYREAERLLRPRGHNEPLLQVDIECAKVHATLALAAAIAAPQVAQWLGDESRESRDWTNAVAAK